MAPTEEPLSLLDREGFRRAVAFSFFVALFFAVIGIFPTVNEIYEKHSAFRNFVEGCAAAMGLLLAFLELRHSNEANEHRKDHIELTKTANDLRDERNKLQERTIELQVRVNELQERIEKRLTKVRIYVRVHSKPDGVQLLVSNLSEFDLWINQVELVVKASEKGKPDKRVIGGANRISRGNSEDGYKLYGALVSINGDRTDRLHMNFYVKVVATGITDDSVTTNSPEYELTVIDSRTKSLVVVTFNP